MLSNFYKNQIPQTYNLNIHKVILFIFIQIVEFNQESNIYPFLTKKKKVKIIINPSKISQEQLVLEMPSCVLY